MSLPKWTNIEPDPLHSASLRFFCNTGNDLNFGIRQLGDQVCRGPVEVGLRLRDGLGYHPYEVGKGGRRRFPHRHLRTDDGLAERPRSDNGFQGFKHVYVPSMEEAQLSGLLFVYGDGIHRGSA